MTWTGQHHRPLLSGIRIQSGTEGKYAIGLDGAGTLTGLATRNSDGRKMLVTNLHVMAGRGANGAIQNPSGDEKMYQGSLTRDNKVGSLPSWDPEYPAWLPFVHGETSVADVAMCELEDGVDADFILHDHPNHSSRKIIAGTKEPTEGMTLKMLGAATGELTNADKAVASFTAPNRLAALTFNLTVTDRFGQTATDAVNITIQPNRAPAAAAGRDQTVDVGVTVTLDGSGSSDPDTGDTLTYSWEQSAGPRVTLSSPTVSSPTFTAPSGPTTLTFRLTVSDGEVSDIDAVTVRVIQTTAEEAVRKYDANNNGLIERSELIKAIQDYLFHNKISRKEVRAIITRHNESVSSPAPEYLRATSGNGQISLDWRKCNPVRFGHRPRRGYSDLLMGAAAGRSQRGHPELHIRQRFFCRAIHCVHAEVQAYCQ